MGITPPPMQRKIPMPKVKPPKKATPSMFPGVFAYEYRDIGNAEVMLNEEEEYKKEFSKLLDRFIAGNRDGSSEKIKFDDIKPTARKIAKERCDAQTTPVREGIKEVFIVDEEHFNKIEISTNGIVRWIL